MSDVAQEEIYQQFLKEDSKNKSSLKEKIETAINSVSAENGSNTPEYILAEFLVGCLEAFDRAVNKRNKHFGI